MKDLLDTLTVWRDRGLGLALARVVNLDGSAPREVGAAMAVNAAGEVAGSVSGGCVEGAVVMEAQQVLAGGERRIVSFGYSDNEAFAVGLTCGGTIELFIEPFNDFLEFAQLSEAIANESPVALATVVSSEVGHSVGAKMLVTPEAEPAGSLGDADLDRVVARDALGELAAGRSGIRHYGSHGEAREAALAVFIESFAPPPKMLIFGAVDFTAALARVAKVLGYRVTVCDARATFATDARFPMADEVAVKWPDRLLAEVGASLGSRDAVCILTHDAKFDVPAVMAALATEVGYIGVMGSRRTHDDRTARLLKAGVDAAGLARLRSPIGLDIGARTPEETAVSITAEIIGRRTGRDARALTDTAGPIHA